MAYNPNIPAATDVLSQSQSDIQGNFQALAPFGAGYADFTVQGATPVIAGTDTGLYTLNNATTTQNEMYIQKFTNGATVQIPMTASIINNTAIINGLSGWTYLPSGILMVWGQYQITANGLTVINVAATSGAPSFTPFSATITPVQTTGAAPTFTAAIAAALANGTGNISVICSNATAANTFINYLVIGA